MRRIWIISLAPLVVLAAVAVLLAAFPARADPMQTALSSYLAQRMQSTGQPQYVAHKVRASHPQALNVSMSAATFGSGVYYRTTFGYADVPTPSQPLTQNVQFQQDKHVSLRPLPYPPREVWCVWLGAPGDKSLPMVLLARHQDLYNAEWIVHEPLAVANDAPAPWLAMGCNAPD